MKKNIFGMSAAALVVLAVSLVGSPAVAKCKGDCRKVLAHEMVACKAACGRGPAANLCRKACSVDHRSGLHSCKAAVNPMPPGCSSSGAFLDAAF